VVTTIYVCGCLHGNLSALKSFTKSEVMYYTHPNWLLEGQVCLDCKHAILDIRPAKVGQRAMVFYCDEGIKGFNVPDDDPLKDELTCDLVLCPQCEAT
jgi:hypothetical protein